MPLKDTTAKPSISVAIATYQGEKFLRQQLESIAKQSLLPMEVVITDDQSSDATLQVAEEFGREAPFPVRVYRNETRLRYADNFLRAASLCKGDLIAFCDQDDLWLEEKLQRCSAYFKNPDVQLTCHAAQTLTPDGTLGYHFPKIEKTVILKQGQGDPLTNLPGFAMVVRRELLMSFPASTRPERLYGHDHWAIFLAAITGTIVKMSDVLVHYRQHETNFYGAQNIYSLGWKMKAAAETPRYLDVANAEADCSKYLSDSIPVVGGAQKRIATIWAKRLARRSSLHSLRYGMYGGHLGVIARAKTYLRILFTGGYLPDRSRTRLGPKAGLKDLVMGVGSVRKLLS